MSLSELAPYIPLVWPVIAGAVAAIPPPDPSSRWFGPYRVANFLALNIGHAQNASYPTRNTQGQASDGPQFPSDGAR